MTGGIGLQHLDRARSEPADLIVVGGGIHGIMAAHEGARRGLRVVLVERDDFGSHTSANSHRIIHGGLRYLQKLDLARLRESARQQAWFVRTFPDLIRPLPCLMPLYGRGLKRPAAFRAALALNRLTRTGIGEACLPGGRVVSSDEVERLFPLVPADGLKGGGVWHDAVMRSHARVAMELLRRAASMGAIALNHVPGEELLIESGCVVGVRVRVEGRAVDLQASAVLNCAGPWCGQVVEAFGQEMEVIPANMLSFNLVFDLEVPDEPRVAASGSDDLGRLKTTPLRSRLVGDYAVAVGLPDGGGRQFFLFERHGMLVAGTGQIALVPGQTMPTRAQVVSMIDELNRAVPGLGLSIDRLVRIEAGRLPSETHHRDEPSERSLVLDHGRGGGAGGLVTLVGVKYTTARRSAQRGLEALFGRHTGSMREPVKETIPLQRSALLDPLWPVADGAPGLADALRALTDQEGVRDLSDLVFNRSEWAQVPSAAVDNAERLADLYGYDAGRKQREVERVEQLIEAGGVGACHLETEATGA